MAQALSCIFRHINYLRQKVRVQIQYPQLLKRLEIPH